MKIAVESGWVGRGGAMMVLVVVTMACQRSPAGSATVSAMASGPTSTPDPTPAAFATAPAAEHRGPGAASAADDPVPTNGVWRTTSMYKVKLDEIRRCSAPASAAGDTPVRVGFFVSVASNVQELFVAARDFSLEQGGVVLEPDVDPKPADRCRTLLVARSLHRNQVAQGLVIFTLPHERYAHSARLVYQATRWGGAPRIELSLPACLDGCREVGAHQPRVARRSQ